MNEKLMQALEAQKAAEAALELAKSTAREAAMEQFREALAACELAGVQLPDLDKKQKRTWTPEQRAQHSARMKATWANKTPEQRAAWAEAVGAPKREAVQ